MLYPNEPADGGDVGVVDPEHAEQAVHLQQAGLLHQLERCWVDMKLSEVNLKSVR